MHPHFLLYLCIFSYSAIILILLLKISTRATQCPSYEHMTDSRLSNVSTTVSDSYTILEFRNFLSPRECRELIDLAMEGEGLKDAQTLDTGDESLSSYNPSSRTSKTRFIPDRESQIIEAIADAAARLTGQPKSHQEQLQVAFYNPGGKFDEHYDACNESKDVCHRFNRGSGNRLATFLIYLNDEFMGGETVFTKLTPNVVIRPEIGKAILFYDSVSGNDVIEASMHRGNPVINGEKWICTKWVHAQPWAH